jgi:hypothetical protein
MVGAAVDHLDGDKDLRGFHGIEKAGVSPERDFGLVDLYHALLRLAPGIDDRSSKLLSQQPAVSYVMPSWVLELECELPSE